MAPQPQSSPYNPLDPETVVSDFQRRLKGSWSHSKDWRDEAKELYDFAAGRQWAPEDEARMDEANRPYVTFNVFAKFIDAVMGLQVNNRQEIRCYPRTNGVAAVSDLASGAIAWNTDQCDGEFEDTDAGHDCLLTGMGWMEIFLDDRSDPEGIIARERRDPLEMYWDPLARKKNAIDGRYVIRLRRMTPEDYREIFGEDPTGSVDVPGLQFSDADMGLQIIETPHDYSEQGSSSAEQARGKIVVADYQFWCVHTYWDVAAQFPEGPGQQQFSNDEWPAIQQQLTAGGIQHQAKRQQKKVYYRCWIAGSEIKGGIKTLPYQEGFTFQAITGKRDRNKNLWYGLGRALKDPQKWVNKFFSSLIWQISVNPKGGLLAEEDAFTDQREAEDSWADPSKITWTAPGALGAGKIQPKEAAPFPAGMQQLTQFSMEALPQTSGMNAELLGLSDRDQPGVVEAQRKQGALAIVAWFFDAMRRYYRRAGHIMLSMIRDFQADGRLIRIAGPEGAQYVPLLKDPLLQRFDIIVDEAPTSVNMRERVWAVLQSIIPMAMQGGITVPKEVLDYAPIPDDLIQKWKQALQPSPDQVQEQNMVKGIKMRQEVARATKDETAAQANQANAQLADVKAQEIVAKTPSDIHLDQVETVRKAAEAGALQAGGS